MSSMNNREFKWRQGQTEPSVDGIAAILGEMGRSASPAVDDGLADKNWFRLDTKTTAASGDNRGLYWKHVFAGAGSGEVMRLLASLGASAVATGGTVNSVHTTLSVPASMGVSGAGNAIRATLEAATATRTLGGTCAALQLDSNIGANNTVPASWSFVRVTDSGTVKIPYLLNIPAASNGTIFAAHTTQTMTHSIKFVDSAGTPYYIMCTNAATNRS